MENWEEWLEWHKDKFSQDEHGYERRFVREIFPYTPLTPDDVTPQYHFVDDNGKNRYIDFLIAVGSDYATLHIAVELDGHAKLTQYGDSYSRFQDMLYRQNEIVREFGTILRFTNKDLFDRPDYIRACIERHVKMAYARVNIIGFHTQDALRQENEISQLQEALAELHQLENQKDEAVIGMDQGQLTLDALNGEISYLQIALDQKTSQNQAQSIQIAQLKRQIDTLEYKLSQAETNDHQIVHSGIMQRIRAFFEEVKKCVVSLSVTLFHIFVWSAIMVGIGVIAFTTYHDMLHP